MKYVPHPYQDYCIQRLIRDPALALWLDMGLGKSSITLTAINDLRYNRFAVRRVLIIAPKKVAEATWSNEAAKWDHLRLLRVSTVLGSQAKRIKALNTPADIYVINRDNVTWLVDYYGNDWPYDMVVIDESSSFKSHQSKRWKSLKAIRPRISRIVELTGTPAPQGLLDLWSQVFLLDGGQRLGKTIGQFRERYFDPDKRDAMRVFTYKPKEGTEESVKALLSDICISMSAEDYLSLPDCIIDTIPVALDGPAQKAYDRLEREAVLEVDDTCIDAGTAAVLTGKLLQLCNGAVYDGEREVKEIHRCKIEAFLETVESLNGQHALVFYNFRHDRDRLLDALAPTGLRVRIYCGPADEEAWNAGEVDLLLAHPASCAYGLNLQQGGHHIIWFGLNWSLELYQQANKRLHRQGQQEPVIVHLLAVRGGRDEDVVDALERKGGTQNDLLVSLKARIEKIKQKGRKTA